MPSEVSKEAMGAAEHLQRGGYLKHGTSVDGVAVVLAYHYKSLTADLAAAKAENERLVEIARKCQLEAGELSDCKEALRDLGRHCGCDHVNGPDERRSQAMHIHEAFEKLNIDLAAAREQLKAVRERCEETIADAKADEADHRWGDWEYSSVAADTAREILNLTTPKEQSK